jgi:hypothetical protein
MALWLVATSLSPVVAISNGSHIGLQNGPPPLVGVGIALRAASGNPIKAALYNGSGDRVRLEGIPIKLEIAGKSGCIADNAAKTDDGGVASFSEAKVICPGFRYRLVAIANDRASKNSGHFATSEPSPLFDALPAFPCTPSGCDKPDVQGKTQARVTADGGKYVLLDVGGSGLDCGGYAESSEIVNFLVTEADGRTTVRITLDDPGKPSNKFEVCFSSPESSFTDKSGATVGPGDAGLLPDCPATIGEDTGTCVVDKFRSSGDQVVIISVRPGDPRTII